MCKPFRPSGVSLLVGLLSLVIFAAGIAVGVQAGFAWDRRPKGWPAIETRILVWPVRIAAPDSLKVTAFAAGAADQLARDRAAAAVAVERQRRLDADIAAQDAAARAALVARTQTLEKEVSTYVTRKADRGCVVTAGFVRLHDAALVSPGGGPAGGADGASAGAAAAPAAGVDQPSGVQLSDVARNDVSNFGRCLVIRQQLVDLQAWERGREQVAAGDGGGR